MEIFIDGGFFELLLAVIFGYAINFIFSKKYLLFLYFILSVTAPVLLVFIDKHMFFYLLSAFCVFNSILLIILLWKEYLKNPGGELVDIKKYTNFKVIKQIRSKLKILTKG